MLLEFLDLYRQKPIINNSGGVQSVGAFSLWYFLRRVNPSLVVESGVWKGFTTWLIEHTLPEAQIICLDPLPQARQYTSPRAIYPQEDFSNLDFSNYDLSNALVFFDDHQNAYYRVLQSQTKGFKHLVFDDNYPLNKNTHLTLQACFFANKVEANYLNKYLQEYQIFSPLFPYHGLITDEKVPINIPALGLNNRPEFQVFKQDMPSYRWMTYVSLDKKIKLGVFPDWQQSEETLYQNLSEAIATIIHHPHNNQLKLLIVMSDIAEEDANLIVTDVVMNLLLESDLDESLESAIELINWSDNLPEIKGRIALSQENQALVAQANIPVINLDNLTL